MQKLSLICVLLTGLICSCESEQQKAAQQRVLPFYSSADFTPRWINDPDSLLNVHRIPPFHFTGQNGEDVTEKLFEGRIYIADFFFTACPGICKNLTTQVAKVQEAFKSDPGILLLSHSVTPEADSVAALRKYASSFGALNGKWFFVTGNRDSLYTLARKAYFADEDMGLQKTSNDFLHTENILLIDKHRRIRGVYKGTSPAEINNLIADIHVLKQEE